MELGSDDDPWDGLNDRTFTLNVFGFASLAWTAGAQRLSHRRRTMPLSVMGKRTPRCGLEEAPASIEKMSRPGDDPPEGWNLGQYRPLLTIPHRCSDRLARSGQAG